MLLIPTLWAHQFSQFPIHSTVHLFQLDFISFSMKMLQDTVSKALLKVNNILCSPHMLQASYLIVEGDQIGIHMPVAWLTYLPFSTKNRKVPSVFWKQETIQEVSKWLLLEANCLTGTKQSAWSEWRLKQSHRSTPAEPVAQRGWQLRNGSVPLFRGRKEAITHQLTS